MWMAETALACQGICYAWVFPTGRRMSGTKISVSLSTEDLEFLDSYTRAHQASRSAAVRRAGRLLRLSELSSDYAAAFDELTDHGHEEAWDAVVADGVQ